MRAPQVGGGFGGKFEPAPEAVVVAALARRLGRAVAWTQTRSENLVGMPHGRGQLQRGALGLRRDGTFVGLWIDVLGDAGAYPIVGALIPNATVVMAPGTYRFERAGGRGRSAVTNTTPMGAYRGAGRPEACALLERLIDIAAASSRSTRSSCAGAISCPPTRSRSRARSGLVYDSGNYPACLDAALAALDYDGLRAEQRDGARRGDAPLLGVGLAMWIDCTPMNRPGEYAAVDVVPDPRTQAGVRVDRARRRQRPGAGAPHDVGHPPRRRARPSGGVRRARARRHRRVPTGEGTGSARSLMLAGNAVAAAGTLARDRARALAADLLEAAVDDIVLTDDGRFAVAGTPAKSVSWRDVVDTERIEVAFDFEQPGPRSRQACTPPRSRWIPTPVPCASCGSSRSTTAVAS